MAAAETPSAFWLIFVLVTLETSDIGHTTARGKRVYAWEREEAVRYRRWQQENQLESEHQWEWQEAARRQVIEEVARREAQLGYLEEQRWREEEARR